MRGWGADGMTTKTEHASDPGSQPAGAEAPGVDEAGLGLRPMRADAVKNRQRILDAAEAIFATEGVSVPIDAVAERAGVGVGTLYRHFPTKEALFEAIVIARLEHLLATAKGHADAADPADALFCFLGEFAQQASAKRDLVEALGSAGIDIKSSCSAMVDEMKRSIDVLLQRAVATGLVRADVSTEEMIGLVVGVCHAGGHPGYDADALPRMVEIVCDGLRSPIAT
jgi:AcrR family transcriptional regulator